ncbi:MAG TPA: cytochrome C biogenesis protein CcsB [Gammaproteobacteria bacterium]|nr:cytochrome C biogenesis protein CcsB [Gammaproteobacteria bacterium]HAU06604.1 cytochrome C biogenesis protein CcsB [Gammaproteobacteria bacterium]
MKHIAYTFLGLTALLGTNIAMAAGDAAAGQAKAASCAACHGADGIATVPNYPSLAGQNEAYLVASMQSYKNKQRKGGMAAIMEMQAANLSDQDIEDISAYYAAMK